MAPKGRNSNPSGLGRAIINKKVKDAREAKESHLYTTELDSASRLQSVTQERDLDEFLSTAQLAGTEFIAEKQNVKIIQSSIASAHNPFLLTDQEEKNALRKHSQYRDRLLVPRRPPWTKAMTHIQLDRQERDAFLDWRRSLAQLAEEEDLLLTPYERNLEVWRQLWRVVERSHLVVQIVDARNPLRFRCEDLEAYVKEVEGSEGEFGTGAGKRRSLLLINKSDLLAAKQREKWADYFDTHGVQYAFFSAINATALQQARREALLDPNIEDDGEDGVVRGDGLATQEGDGIEKAEFELSRTHHEAASPESEDFGNRKAPYSIGSHDDSLSLDDEDEDEDEDPRTRVLSVLELEALFISAAPDLNDFVDVSGAAPPKLVIGLVGYPNVGKSSTINSLLGEKKVSVSSTPGKTKHFQTIHLSDSIVLCDCPGLVFPQFATTKAELVCDGVLPIDQLREHTGPISLVVRRVPKEVLEATYGLSIKTKGPEEGGDGNITAENLLIASAIARGFARSGQGNPDEARAARYILKDYVNAKLLYCHPPPGNSEDEFNEPTRDLALHRVMGKKRAPTTRVGKNADTFVAPAAEVRTGDETQQRHQINHKARAVEESFFGEQLLSARPFVQGGTQNGQQYSRGTLYPHQHAVADDGTLLDGRRARIAAVLASAGGADGARTSKKHFKGNKRVKQRSGKGYDL